jgi:hypothetical protein
MQFTKTSAQLQERRARIAQLNAEGRVMNSNQQARLRKQAQQQQKLQEQAEMILAGINSTNVPSRRYQDISPIEKVAAPVATSQLKINQKEDQLALKANQVLKELLG